MRAMGRGALAARGAGVHPRAPAPRSHLHAVSQLQGFRAGQLSWATAPLLPHLLIPHF